MRSKHYVVQCVCMCVLVGLPACSAPDGSVWCEEEEEDDCDGETGVPDPGGLCATHEEPPGPAYIDDAVVFEVGGVARAKFGAQVCSGGLDPCGDFTEKTVGADTEGSPLEVVFEIGIEPDPPMEEFLYPRPYNVGACCSAEESDYSAANVDMMQIITEAARRDCGASVCLQAYKELLYQSENFVSDEFPDIINPNARKSFKKFAEQLENPNFFLACRNRALAQDDESAYFSITDVEDWSGVDEEGFVLPFNGDTETNNGTLKQAYLGYACQVEAGPAVPSEGPQACDTNPNNANERFPAAVVGDRGGGEIDGGIALILPNNTEVPITGSSYQIQLHGCGLLSCPVTLSELDLRANTLKIGPFRLLSPEAHLAALAFGRSEGEQLIWDPGTVAMTWIFEVRVGKFAPFGAGPISIKLYNSAALEATLEDETFTIDVLEFALGGVGPSVDRLWMRTDPAPFVLEE